MTGNGSAIAIQPAEAAAAATPIQRPAMAASVSLALREMSMNVVNALTMNTMSATVAINPSKSSIGLLPIVYLHAFGTTKQLGGSSRNSAEF
jgi:hypothetical protein